MRVKVTLVDADGEEVEFGPFNQGVHFEWSNDGSGHLLCCNTAGKPGENVIARFSPVYKWGIRPKTLGELRKFERLHVQAVS